MDVNQINIKVNLIHMQTYSWRRLVAAGYAASPALTVLGFIMAADLVFCMAGLVVDRRVITGAPAWLKPAIPAEMQCLEKYLSAHDIRYSLRRSWCGKNS
jgi:hypothetical protein